MLATKTTQSDWLALDRHQWIGSHTLFDHSPHSFNPDRRFPASRLTQSDAILANDNQTATDVNQPGFDKFTSAGVVNADTAVRRAIALARGFA